MARAGSRAKQTHTCKSDLDVIFFVSGNPLRDNYDPELVSVLKSNFQEAHGHKVYPGRNNNVVHLETSAGGVFDFVLLSEYDFDKQHGDDVEWRRDHL